jgi:hypothetical protein
MSIVATFRHCGLFSLLLAVRKMSNRTGGLSRVVHELFKTWNVGSDNKESGDGTGFSCVGDYSPWNGDDREIFASLDQAQKDNANSPHYYICGRKR